MIGVLTKMGAGNAPIGRPSNLATLPWWVEHAKNYLNTANVCLVIGILFVLYTIGGVDFGVLKFQPAEGLPNQVRFVLIIIGTALILFGLAENLRTTHIWRPAFSLIYFFSNLLAVLVITVQAVLVHEARPEGPTPNLRRFITHWNADDSFCYTSVTTPYLRDRYQEKELLLICRRYDSSMAMESDKQIQKSDRRRLNLVNTVEEITIKFSEDFSNTLRKGEVVEFSLLLMPKDFTVDRIETIADAIEQGGELLDVAYKDIDKITKPGLVNKAKLPD